MPSDAESTEVSSQALGPSSQDNPEPAMSSSLSAYHGEETREVEYMWVDNRVREVFFKYTDVSILHDFVESFDIVLKGMLNGAFALRRCREFETICLGRGEEAKDFFYFYSCLISNIHVRFTFDEFTMEVLRVLNVAPTQLHPNSWVALQAFRLLCEVLGLKPTPRPFLHFFGTRPGDQICWVS